MKQWCVFEMEVWLQEPKALFITYRQNNDLEKHSEGSKIEYQLILIQLYKIFLNVIF